MAGSLAEKYARYNASPKGKARKARYEATESGRAVRRAAERRSYRAKAASRAELDENEGLPVQPG